MTLRRYSRTPLIKGGTCYSTHRSAYLIYRGVESGLISSTTYKTTEGDRLDVLAGRFYGDGRMWWVLAAASGVGWSLQVQPDTIIRIPDIGQVSQLVG